MYVCPALLLILMLAGSIGPGFIFASENEESDANSTSQQNQKAAKDKKTPRPQHTHPAFSQGNTQRAEMVAEQIQRRRVRDPNVLRALRTVPRHAFVRPADLRRAYSDQPLPIGLGQTISQPYIVGYMTEALKLTPESKVLEVGTGSGYQAAVCAEIAQEVYTVEILEGLAEAAKKEEKQPFDAIIVTCAAGFVPRPLIDQLKPDGKIIAPLGSPFGAQTLVLITKDKKGQVRSKRLLPVRFVPMVGRITVLPEVR